jgi:predicted O-linked N-acetylglucosamine transferase (SPINDLY family)
VGERREDWLERAREHHRAGRLEDATSCYRRALQAGPDQVDALIGLVDVLQALGRPTEAVERLEQAVARSPDSAALHGRLADAHHAQGNLSAAIEAYRRAIALGAEHAAVWWGLGCALASQGDHAAAVESFRRLVAIEPDHGMALTNLGKSLFELGQVDPALEAFRRSLAVLPEGADCVAMANIAIVIPGSPMAGNREILEARRAWAARCLPAASADRAFEQRSLDPDRPIRLGYVSAFFDKPNWMKPVWALINHQDRHRFEIHLFSDRPGAAIGPVYRRDPRDTVHDTGRLSNPELARLIEELRIDVLIDLNGYSGPHRLALFALRPAPVQAAWFNMFGTSGLSSFDYIIGDRHVVPPEEDVFYSERIVRVPGSYLTFEVTYPVPEVAPVPCLGRGALTFGCLAPQYKITSEVVEAWLRILRACPETRLLLKSAVLGRPEAREFVCGLFARSDVTANRLLLEGPADHYDFLGRYAEVDLALDTFPYNGGTTTAEALWQGVPVLTFTGDRWATRISASLLREAGLPEFVAPDLESYVARAIALAQDPATPGRLVELRRGLRDRLRAAPVCDAVRFARDMEKEYLGMLHQTIPDVRETSAPSHRPRAVEVP